MEKKLGRSEALTQAIHYAADNKPFGRDIDRNYSNFKSTENKKITDQYHHKRKTLKRIGY